MDSLVAMVIPIHQLISPPFPIISNNLVSQNDILGAYNRGSLLEGLPCCHPLLATFPDSLCLASF